MENKTDLALRDIADHSPGVIYQYRLFPDGHSCFPYASERIVDIYGVKPEDVLEDATVVINKIHPDDLEGVMASIAESAKTMEDWKCEYRVILPEKNIQWLLGHSRPEKLSDGSILWRGFITNISKRKKLEEELVKTARLYSVTSKINELMIHFKKQDEVFSEACRIAVEEGHFRLAWVGIEDPVNHVLVPVTWSGFEDGYLKAIKVSTLAESPESHGPSGNAFREGKISVLNNLAEGTYYTPWRKEALARGYSSSIALPIFLQGKVIGTFNLYSSAVNFFSDSEVELLGRVVNNISFAIEAFANETQRKKGQELLRKSEEMFSAITNLSPDIISVVNERGELIFNSSAALRIHGYSEEDLIGVSTMTLIHPDDQVHVTEALQELIKNPEVFAAVQYRYRNKDGSYIWMEATAFNQLKNPHLGGIIVISRDVSHRKKMEDDLRAALAVRDEFLSIASHELKTPLTSLKLQLQILGRELKPGQNILPNSEKVTKFITLSARQVDRISDLIENLLDVTRIKAGKLGLFYEDFDLSELLSDSIERFEVLFEAAACKQIVDVEQNITGSWDKNRVEQVFVNLISNAIKYAPGKPIRITLKKIDHMVHFVVEDQGPGISEENQRTVFQRFERGKTANAISGVGLGLFITKQVVEAHHGKIQLVSRPGFGCKFTVELPLNPEAN